MSESSEEEEERDSFVFENSQGPTKSVSSKSKSATDNSKPATKKRRNPPESDSDSESERAPLSSSNHENRVKVRQQHDSMPGKQISSAKRLSKKRLKTGGSSGKRSQKSKHDQEDFDEEECRVKCKYVATNNAEVLQAQASDAMVDAVWKTAKRYFWKVSKFIKNEQFHAKATNYVLLKLMPTEIADLEGKERIEAEENWKVTYANEVLQAHNKHRNYSIGEIRKYVYGKLCKNEQDTLPNKQDIVKLMVRDDLDGGTDPDVKAEMEAKFVTYVDVLLPKVAGNSHWAPGIRHYELPSSAKVDAYSENSELIGKHVECVSAADEAFLVVVYLNYYDKWVAQAAKYIASVNARKKDSTKELYDPKKDKTDYNCPYTNKKSGNAKYGGWNEAGIKKFDSLKKRVIRNRESQHEFNEEVEENCRLALQKMYKIVEAAATEAVAKGSKSKTKNAFANVDAGKENDFSTW